MINFNDNTIKKTKEHYPNCQSILDTDTDYQKAVVLDQEKQNGYFVSQQWDIVKTYEPKYQLPINTRESVCLKSLIILRDFSNNRVI